MNWMIPDVEPYARYVVAELFRWIGANAFFLTIIGNALTGLKVWAVRSHRATDDKILTLLLSFISFAWLKRLTNRGEQPSESSPRS